MGNSLATKSIALPNQGGFIKQKKTQTIPLPGNIFVYVEQLTTDLQIETQVDGIRACGKMKDNMGRKERLITQNVLCAGSQLCYQKPIHTYSKVAGLYPRCFRTRDARPFIGRVEESTSSQGFEQRANPEN